MRAEYVLVTAVAGVAFLLVAGLLLNVVFYVRIRQSDRPVWQSLGSPSLWKYMDMARFGVVRRSLRDGTLRPFSDKVAGTLSVALCYYYPVLLGYTFAAAAAVGAVVLFVKP
jgi:hypothetical protein